MPKKIFVLIPYMGRSDEDIQTTRENAVALWNLYQKDNAELVIPQGKRLTGDLEAMLASDVVIMTKYHSADPVCNIVEQAASIYDKLIYDDRYIPDIRDEAVPENPEAVEELDKMLHENGKKYSWENRDDLTWN